MKASRFIAYCAGALLWAAGLAGAAAAAGSEEADWPCVQRKVPEISAGMVWAGPPVDQLRKDWRQDVEVSQLAGAVVRRKVPIEEAESKIAEFAAGLGDDRNEKLTLLFAAALSIINEDRSSLMAGIERYARRQAALARRIEDETRSLNELPADDSAESQAKREDLQEALTWDTRIYQEREQSLKYVCETPVTLEKRIFALARAIMAQLEQ